MTRWRERKWRALLSSDIFTRTNNYFTDAKDFQLVSISFIVSSILSAILPIVRNSTEFLTVCVSFYPSFLSLFCCELPVVLPSDGRQFAFFGLTYTKKLV